MDLPTRGGEKRGYNVDQGEIIEILTDALLNVGYNSNLRSANNEPFQKYDEYTDNKSFWKDALSQRFYSGQPIRLKDFYITEWLPFSPGRFFTPNAIEARNYALDFWQNELNEYTPKGKTSMVSGGIGCVRLAEKAINKDNLYFLGGSSTGISHEGIPLVLMPNQYDQVIQSVKKYGGCRATLSGHLKQLPNNTISLDYARGIPRYSFCVEKVLMLEPPDPNKLSVSVAVVFLTNSQMFGERVYRKHSWSYCSFVPNSPNNVNQAADWLTKYAQRYSEKTPTILTDFDEQYQLFDCDVEFPISEIVSGKIKISNLDKYLNNQSNNIYNWYVKITKEINVAGDVTGSNLSVDSSLNGVTANAHTIPKLEKKD